jgi:hypothetical protein
MSKLLFKPFFAIAIIWCMAYQAYAQTGTRWQITKDGGIAWDVIASQAHTDHVEMSGKRISCILTYGIDKAGNTELSKKLIFPLLRTIPNNTHGSLTLTDTFSLEHNLFINGKITGMSPTRFYQKGYLFINGTANAGVNIERSFYPSTDKAAFIEQVSIYNHSTSAITLTLPLTIADRKTPAEKGVDGIYILHTEVTRPAKLTLKPGDQTNFSIISSARKLAEPQLYISADYEFARRQAFIGSLSAQLQLQTPDPVINKMFEFAKFRLTESIFDTKGGLMHSPGGGPFYAAIWANDQAEYVSPLFPFLGNMDGNESAINCYRLFAGYMNPEYNPIPSSIVAEGVDTWHGAGDRGDQAMIAYGASRFALAYGDLPTAQKLWPLIRWCLTYLEKKKTPQGVIGSDSDELEGRFPAGKINLATNSLAYGALISAAKLAAVFGDDTKQKKYMADATALSKAIEQYFGTTVEGFKTYRYYDGNDKLRAWICLPLVMGLTERKYETAKALLSNKLWTKDGILTESGSKTFWDRATLYAFRGLYNAGFTDTATKYLGIYSGKRLLGDHVPYAIEAWPEGDKRQLSAESGLYCRIITEGLFGIDPIGLRSFSINPILPKKWDTMTIKHVRAFNADITITVNRVNTTTQKIKVFNNDKLLMDISWDKKKTVIVKI